MVIDFKFDIDEKVKTALGSVGIVSTCALDESKQNIYYVKRADGADWYPERQLEAVNIKDGE